MAGGRILASKFDDETIERINRDCEDLSNALGMSKPLTYSQYLRYVVSERLDGSTRSVSLGWSEGYKAAYAEAMSKITLAMKAISNGEDDVLDPPTG